MINVQTLYICQISNITLIAAPSKLQDLPPCVPAKRKMTSPLFYLIAPTLMSTTHNLGGSQYSSLASPFSLLQLIINIIQFLKEDLHCLLIPPPLDING